MTDLEISSQAGSENDKTNIRHKYTLSKPLETVFHFNNKSDYSASDTQNNSSQLKQLKQLEDT